MSKHIVIITGKANTGKTMSICLYFWHLIKYNKHNVLYLSKKPKYPLPTIGSKSDFITILEVMGVKVGFCSYGDPGEEDTIESSLKLFASYNCDLIIGARRTRGGTFNVYRNFCANNPQYTPNDIKPIYYPAPAMQQANNNLIATAIGALTTAWFGFK